MSFPDPTRRLSYRPVDTDDAEALHAVWSDPEVMRYLPSDPDASIDETVERIGRHRRRYDQTGYGLCAVIERESGDVVGVCGLFPVEWVGPDVEVAYHFARRVWGRGYATEAAGAWIDLALGPLGLPRVVALAYPANRASTRVMEKIGMGGVRDVERYGETLVQYSLDRPSA
jgi:RimJ/RimL family protein N-acetyltransferase